MLAIQCARSARCASSAVPLWIQWPRGKLSSRPLWSTHVRIFTTTPRHRKDDPRIQILQQQAGQKTEVPEGIKPETVQKPKPAIPAGQDPLLAEQTVSNKEQRKADWAIIKEMSKYLWPKVLS